jgi:hypothetical protein
MSQNLGPRQDLSLIKKPKIHKISKTKTIIIRNDERPILRPLKPNPNEIIPQNLDNVHLHNLKNPGHLNPLEFQARQFVNQMHRRGGFCSLAV